MKQIKTINEALLLLSQQHSLLCKPYGQKEMIYTLVNDQILVQNKNFKTLISKDQFTNDFKNFPFYLINVTSKDEDIDQTHIVWRQ